MNSHPVVERLRTDCKRHQFAAELFARDADKFRSRGDNRTAVVPQQLAKTQAWVARKMLLRLIGVEE